MKQSVLFALNFKRKIKPSKINLPCLTFPPLAFKRGTSWQKRILEVSSAILIPLESLLTLQESCNKGGRLVASTRQGAIERLVGFC